MQVQVEQAGTTVKTTEAGTVTEWEHFDYGYHSGTPTQIAAFCNNTTKLIISLFSL